VFFRVAADAVLVIHLLFVLFVVGGAFFVLRDPKLAWIHVPAACWGIFVELTGRICPLTTLENVMLKQAGLSGYSESFVQHYVVPIIYPTGLTPQIQYALAVIVALINGAAYSWILYRWWLDREEESGDS